jgi:hypothetical protein
MACSWRRYAGGPVVVVDPLVCQARPGVLSVRVCTIRLHYTLATINLVHKHVVLSDGAGELEVGIGDQPCRVVDADKIKLDHAREWCTPEEGDDDAILIRDEENAPHAGSGNIRGTDGTNGTGSGVYYFPEACGTGMKVPD